MASFSFAGSNFPPNESTSSSNDSSSSNINNAPPPNPKPIPLLPPLLFLIFPLPPQVFLPQKVQPWERNEEQEGEDSKEFWLKAEKDAGDEAHNAFMGAASRHKIRCKAF